MKFIVVILETRTTHEKTFATDFTTAHIWSVFVATFIQIFMNYFSSQELDRFSREMQIIFKIAKIRVRIGEIDDSNFNATFDVVVRIG